MKIWTLSLLAVLTLFIFASTPICARASGNDEKEIAALEEHLMASIRAKDLGGVMSCYVANDSLFVFDVIPPRQYVGAKAYGEDWKGVLAGFSGPVTSDSSDLKITVDRNLAYSHSIQHVSGTGAKGEKIDFTMRATDVYRRVNGKWLIVHEHYSVPVDLSTAKADLSSKP